MARIVVIGGGMAGLTTALFSARRGHDVVVVERGEAPPEGSDDDLAAWGTFSAAASFSADDPLRMRLQDPEVFDRMLAAVPLTASWLEHADPVSDLHVMAAKAVRPDQAEPSPGNRWRAARR